MGRWRVALVVACVLAAGCSTATGVWSSTDAESTLTPAPVPETPAVSAASVPGVFADGSLDADRLARAHAGATTGRTYTWVFRLTRTDPDTGTRVVDGTRRVRVGPDATLVTEEGLPKRDGTRNQTVYLTDRRGYRQSPRLERETIIDETHGNNRYVFTDTLLRFNLRDRGYRLKTVERGGKRLLRLYHPPNASETDSVTEPYTATVLVARTGFVHRFAVAFTDLRGDRVSLRFRYTAVGTTTAPEPGWVSRLRETANDRDATPSPTRTRTRPEPAPVLSPRPRTPDPNATRTGTRTPATTPTPSRGTPTPTATRGR